MHLAVTITALSLMTFAILFGNVLVILSVLLYRKLRKNLTSYLILSLAVADVSVGALILPFSTANSALGEWVFGELWCRLWLMLDVFLCTASIYNLVAISIDRFFAIVRPMSYVNVITPKRVSFMVFFAWSISFVICLPPLMIRSIDQRENKTFQWGNVSENVTVCSPLHNSPAYVIFSAFGSFYLPMAVIIVIYTQIFLTARKVSLATAKGYLAVSLLRGFRPNFILDSHNNDVCPTCTSATDIPLNQLRSRTATIESQPDVLRIHCGKYSRGDSGSTTPNEAKPADKICHSAKIERKLCDLQQTLVEKDEQNTSVASSSRNSFVEEIKSAPIGASLLLFTNVTPIQSMPNANISGNSTVAKMLKRKKFIRNLKLEIRAAKTVAVITGCFIMCWLGFAVIYLLSAFPFCPNNSCVPNWLSGIFFWLGYVNSGLNVVIYAFFSKNFRKAFKHILCLKRL